MTKGPVLSNRPLCLFVISYHISFHGLFNRFQYKILCAHAQLTAGFPGRRTTVEKQGPSSIIRVVFKVAEDNTLANTTVYFIILDKYSSIIMHLALVEALLKSHNLQH